jgi:cyclopropane fatty-acyl-phospholipid synthase-like methyltransferase
MPKQYFDEKYGLKPPENYERFFVPTIGEPLANDLIRLAALRPDERILDVACGTGIVARLATQQVGSNGTVAGLDVNPGMLEVARSITPAGMSIEWYESSDVGGCPVNHSGGYVNRVVRVECRRYAAAG